VRPDPARLMSRTAHPSAQFLNTPAKLLREKYNQSVHNGTELPPGSDYSTARKRTIADWLALSNTEVGTCLGSSPQF
jgi:hypothetical protein